MKIKVFAILLMISVCAFGAYSQTKTKVRSKPASASQRAKKHKKMRKKTVNSLAVTTASGLTYMITKHGTGAQLKAGDTVIINYTGLFTNGAKFDSSLDSNEPLQFPLGAGRVIRGWDEGLQKLHVGDHATFIVPPNLGYGAAGAYGVIPPNATLIFNVDVVGVK